MKRSLALLTLLCLATAASATVCTNGALQTSYPKCDKFPSTNPPTSVPTSPSQSQQQTTSSSARAQQSVVSSPHTSSTATGGASEAKSDSKSKSESLSKSNANVGDIDSKSAAQANGTQSLSGIGNSTDQSSSSFKAIAISLPTPVFTPPMPISSCPQANGESHAVALGWNFFSKADSFMNADNCTAIIIYNNLLAQCKYKSAHKLLTGLTRKIIPDYEAEDHIGLDLTVKECSDLKSPSTVTLNQATSTTHTSGGPLLFPPPGAGPMSATNWVYQPRLCQPTKKPTKKSKDGKKLPPPPLPCK